MDPYAKKQNYGALFSAGNDDYGNLARYMNDVDAKAERQRKIDYIMNESWPAKAAKSAWGAFTLPMEVYQGKVDPLSDEGIQRTADLAGMVTLGAGAVPSQGKHTLRMGLGAPEQKLTRSKFDLDYFGTPVRILQNPTKMETSGFLNRTKYKAARRIKDPSTGDTYIWDAADPALHQMVAEQLGFAYDPQFGDIIGID